MEHKSTENIQMEAQTEKEKEIFFFFFLIILSVTLHLGLPRGSAEKNPPAMQEMQET